MADIAVPSVATGTPTSADTVLGVQSGVTKRFGASPPFAQLAAVTGAGLVGYSDAEVYGAGTVGAAIQAAAGGGGAVDSVNGKTGVVVLNADDIADGTTNHAFTALDDTKLAGIATGATANSSDATLLDRANHTGTQLAATISDFATAADARVAAAVGVSVQAQLVSATNIKTINGASLLG